MTDVVIFNNLEGGCEMKAMTVVLIAAMMVMAGCVRQIRPESVEQKLGENPVVYASSSEEEEQSWVGDEEELNVLWHPSGALIKATDSTDVYVVEAALKHLIKDEEVFMAHGWTWSQVIEVSDDELDCYADGVAINWTPQRIFFSVDGSDIVYMAERQAAEVDSCLVYPLASTLAAQSWGAIFGAFDSYSEEEAVQEFFSKCGEGVVLFVRAGTIVKPLFTVSGFGPGVIFAADGDGVLRPFENYGTYKAMGYENVPMIAAFDQDDFYASFVMFGDRISSEAAETCAAVDGIYKEPEGTDVGGEEEDVPVNDIDTDEECEGGIGGAIAEDDVSFLAPQGDIVEEFSDEDQSDIEFSDDDVAIEEKDGGWVDDGQVECVFVCPEGMIAWIWYGEYGEKFADGKLTWKSSEKEICERGFPWVDFNCAAPDWTTFDPSLAVIECNQSFVRHSGVIDFNGEGELFFKDFVCYQWKPPVAKACGKYCIALSAYYLFRADSAYVVGDLSGAGEDLAAAKKIQIAGDEYYHFEFGESAPGLYHLQYATINQEFAYFDGDWISVVVDVAGNTATSIE